MKLNLSKVVCLVGLFLLMVDMPAFAQNNHNLAVTEVQFSPVPIPVDSSGIGPMTATLAFNNLASSPADEWDGGTHPVDPIELVMDLNLARLRNETDIDSNFSGLFSNYFTCTYSSFANKVISCLQNADIPGSELIGYTSAGYMVIDLMTTQASLQPQSNIALNINIIPAAYYGDNRTEDDSAYSTAYTEEIAAAVSTMALVKTSTLNRGADGILNAGDKITYTYTASNVGQTDIYDISISETGFQGLGITPTPTYVSGGSNIAGNSTIKDIAENAGSIIFTAEYTIVQADITAGKVQNQATASAQSPAGATVTAVSDDVTKPGSVDPTVTLLNDGILAVSKTAVLNTGSNGILEAGDTIEYTYVVSNEGLVDVYDITLVETSFVGQGSTPLPVYNSGGTSLGGSSSVKDLAANGSSIIFKATYALVAADITAGQVLNQATAQGTDTNNITVSAISNDPTTSAPLDPTVVALNPAAALGLVKQGVLNFGSDGMASVGDSVIYTFTATNVGATNLHDISITDRSSEFTGTGTRPLAYYVANTGDDIDQQGDNLDLLVGGVNPIVWSATYNITQADIDAGSISNIADARSIDRNNGANIVNAVSHSSNPLLDGSTNVILSAKPQLTVNKTAAHTDTNQDGQISTGDVITYSFTVSNTGNVALSPVTITDSKLGINNVTCNSPSTLAVGNTNVACVISQSSSYTITAADASAGSVTNYVTATGRPVNSTTGAVLGVASATGQDTNIVSPVIPIAGADLVVTKTASPLIVSPNGIVTYTIKVTNVGGASANNVNVTEYLPAGMSYVSQQGTMGSYNSTTKIWSVGTLAANASATLSLTSRLSDVNGAYARDYVNTVVANTTSVDTNPSNNTATVTVGLGAVGIAKKLATAPVPNGNGTYKVTYDFIVKNIGDSILTNVQVSDDLIAMINSTNRNYATMKNVELTSTDLSVSTSYDGNNNINMLLGIDTLLAGEVSEFQLTFDFDPHVYLGPFNNTATVTAQTSTGVAVSDESQNSSIVGQDAPTISGTTPFNIPHDDSVPVTLSQFSSELQGGQFVFNWTTEVEVSNSGFNISVQNTDGSWSLLNESLIASKGNSVYSTEYSFTASDVREESTDVTKFRFTDVSVTGSEVHHGPYVLGETSGKQVERKATDWSEINKQGGKKKMERIQERKDSFQRKLENLKSSQQDEAATISRPIFNRLLAGAMSLFVAPVSALDIVNFQISETGVYRVTQSQLAYHGANLTGFTTGRIGLKSGGVLVPLSIHGVENGIFSSGSYIEFPATSKKTLYSAINKYTLVIDDGQNLIKTDETAVPYKGAAISYLEKTKYAPQNVYSQLSPNKDDAWFADTLAATSSSVEKTISLTLENKAASLSGLFSANGQSVNAKPSLQVKLWGATSFSGLGIDGVNSPDHHVVVSLNNHIVADERFDGLTMHDIDQPINRLYDGLNKVKIRLPKDHSYSADTVNIDEVTLSYPRRFVAKDGGKSLVFESSWDKFALQKLASDDIRVYRLDTAADGSFADTAYEMTSRGSEDSAPNKLDLSSCVNSKCAVVFAGSDTRTTSTYFVATQAGVKTPGIELAVAGVPQSTSQASYLVIAHPDFINTNGQLLESYVSDLASIYGSADLVNIESIYASFSGSVVSADAIQAYIKDVYKNRGTRHIALIGGDTYDYRNVLSSKARSFIPTKYVQVAQNLFFVPSDATYGDINDDQIPDIDITRFPVRTEKELSNMLAKRKSYNSYDYRNKTVIAADKQTAGYDFKSDAIEAIGNNFSDWTVVKAFIDDTNAATAKSRLINGINSGSALTTYFGHSNKDSWSIDGIMSGSDAARLYNFGKPTVIAQFGCWNTYLVSPTEDSMAHRLLVEGKNGAVVVMGAASLTQADGEKQLAKLLYKYLAQGKRVGDAVLSAKREFAKTNPYKLDILLGWTVLGPSDLIVK